MNITLNIEAGTPAELQEAIVGLAGIVGFVQDGPAIQQTKSDQEKPKRNSRTTTKTDKPTDSQPDDEEQQSAEQISETEKESAEEVTSHETGDGPGDSEEHIPTVVELRAAAQEKGKTPEGKQAIRELLNKFGSKSISDVPEKKRAAFLAELEAL